MLVTMVAKEFRFNDTVQNHDVSPVFSGRAGTDKLRRRSKNKSQHEISITDRSDCRSQEAWGLHNTGNLLGQV